MKKSILILSISIFSLTLFAQTPQNADVTTKNERTSITQDELTKIKEKRVAAEIHLKTLQEKNKTNPSDDMLQEIESLKKRVKGLKKQELKPVKKVEREKPGKPGIK